MIRDISRFDNWFSSSYYRIRSKLSCYFRLNEDAFHDTYLSIRLNLSFEKVEILDFESYFIGCYKRISLKRIKHEQRYCHPENIFFQLLNYKEPIPVEDLLAPDKLAHDILDFVKKKFSENEYKLFRLRNFETECSYKDLSDYTGVSPSVIYKKVNSISNAVRRNSSFVWRNSQLTAINN